MNTENARILVIGAGVNGSICATGLHQAGIDVTLLARGTRYEEIRDGGVVIENPFKNTRSVSRVPVINCLDPQDVYEYVLVVVRKNQVADLLPVLARNQSPNIVFMVNNPSGPGEFCNALGKERVMLGFVFGAGKRDGGVIRAMAGVGTASSLAGLLWPSPFGEIDGAITPRLTRLVGILRRAGFAAGISRNVTDYLATHAALVAPMAGFLMQRGYDRLSLARYTRDDFGLLVDALREVLDVLPAVGVRVTPPSTAVLKIIPRFLLVAWFRVLLPTKFMEVGALYHVSQAPDEMRQLGIELMALVARSGLPVPAIRKLCSDPSVSSHQVELGQLDTRA
jgi:2-dehydropantoate 2-reductase